MSQDRTFLKLKGKQLPWLRAYLDESDSTTFLNKKESARVAGYKADKEATLANIGCQNYIKLQPRINAWLEENGLSEAYLQRKLISLVNAKETKFFAHEGKVTDQVDVEALGIQKGALDMAFKVKGSYAAEKHDHTHRLELLTDEELAKRLARLIAEGLKK